MTVILKSEVIQAHENRGVLARPWVRTGSLDVEVLARWAFAVQMVDRFERMGLHPIEAAAMGYEPRGFSSDGVGQLMAIHHLGCRVDRGGVSISDAVHPVAYALAQVLRGIEHGTVVKVQALAGSRPAGWAPVRERYRPVNWFIPGDKPLVVYQGAGRSGGYCPLVDLWDAQRQAWGQAEYRKWWTALEELAWRLSTKPLGFLVTGPAAPPEPWREAPAEPEGAPPNGSSHPISN